MSHTPASDQTGLPKVRIYPKLKAWENAIRVVLEQLNGSALHDALYAASVYATKNHPQGIYWLNPTHAVLSYKDHSLVFFGNVAGGIEQAAGQFMAISETNHRYRWFSPSYWIARKQRKRLTKVGEPSNITPPIVDLLHFRKPSGFPPEMDIVYEFLRQLSLRVGGDDVYYNTYNIYNELEIMICTDRATYWAVIDFTVFGNENDGKFPVEL